MESYLHGLEEEDDDKTGQNPKAAKSQSEPAAADADAAAATAPSFRRRSPRRLDHALSAGPGVGHIAGSTSPRRRRAGRGHRVHERIRPRRRSGRGPGHERSPVARVGGDCDTGFGTLVYDCFLHAYTTQKPTLALAFSLSMQSMQSVGGKPGQFNVREVCCGVQGGALADSTSPGRKPLLSHAHLTSVGSQPMETAMEGYMAP